MDLTLVFLEEFFAISLQLLFDFVYFYPMVSIIVSCYIFIDTFTTHLNTTFSSGRVVSIINNMETTIEPEMERHIIKWTPDEDLMTIDHWWDKVGYVRWYAEQRTQIVKEHIEAYFGIDIP